MKKVGIICEYNPLHNGHIYHFNKVKEESKADIIICVMSSSFTQRGDLSLFDKFIKTKQALNMGIDLIIELPLIYTIERADIFASYSVKLLNSLNVDEIWIGSENNDTSIYEKYYSNIQIDNKEDYSTSYKDKSNIDLLSNDILGFSYYKAIKDNSFNIKLNTIKRIENNYLDSKANDSNIQSALTIRNNISDIEKYTPQYVSADKDLILDENKLFSLIKYKILSSNKKDLKNIFFVDEGIENKLYDIKNYNDLNSFIEYLSNKRYSKSRIKRMLIYVLLNVTKSDANLALDSDLAVRILGYNDIGKSYLKTIKKDLVFYTNIKNDINIVFDIELKASKILDSVYNINLLDREMKGPITK
ncbi:MAG: nucleotidyltransferase family protein [Acholeplasmatales bacterium]|nr:nucleotidyltransferase family protein [Acholeplasmatales bacterium]